MDKNEYGKRMKLKERVGYTYLKYLLTGVFSAVLVMGYAQEVEKKQEEKRQPSEQQDENQPAIIESMDVVREYRPILADAVKIRQTPDMSFDRQALELELRKIAAARYFAKNIFKQAYYDDVLKRHADASQNNIDNYRIGYLAYQAREYERAASIMKKVTTSDAFYQSSLITLGHIALESGDKQGASNAFAHASKLDLDPILKVDGLFNYAKVLYELDSVESALRVAQQYIAQKYEGRGPETRETETEETLSVDILLGTS